MSDYENVCYILQGVLFAIAIAMVVIYLTSVTMGIMSVATTATIIYTIAVAVVK